MARILARPERIGVDADVIQRTLDGRLKISPDGTIRESSRYLLVGREGAARPDPVQAAWLYRADGALGAGRVQPGSAQDRRGGVQAGPLRCGAWGCAGTQDRGASGSVGAFAGPAFDPADVAGYLASFKVSRRVR